MTDIKLIDSSVWIAYLFEDKFKDILENLNDLLLSIISLFEIKKKLLKRKVPSLTIQEKLDYIKQRSIIIPITEPIAEKAAELSVEKKIPMSDSIIYVSAQENNASVVTLDNHFRGLKNSEVLKI